MTNITITEEVYKLYKALRCKRPNFRKEDYIWKLGTNTIARLLSELNPNAIVINPEEYGYLYGIRVESDFDDDNGLRLMEDITNKI